MEDFVAGLAAHPWQRRAPVPPFEHPEHPGAVHGRPTRPMTVGALFRQINAFLEDDMVVIADPGDALFGAEDLYIHDDARISSAPAYYCSLGFAVPAALGVNGRQARPPAARARRRRRLPDERHGARLASPATAATRSSSSSTTTATAPSGRCGCRTRPSPVPGLGSSSHRRFPRDMATTMIRTVLCYGDSNTFGHATVERPDMRYGRTSAGRAFCAPRSARPGW